MARSIRRLGPGDEALLELLANEDADFDLAERGEPLRPLAPAAARRYLENPAVLHWVAYEDETLAGFLYCLHLPLRAGDAEEVLLYEIGVRQGWRRRGIGHALLATMEEWMRAHGVAEVWLGADNPGAVEFYRAFGFVAAADRPLYMTRRLVGI